MKKISFVAIFSVLLLAGCGASRPAGGWATCECERTVKVPDGAFRAWLVENGYAEKAGWHKLKPTAQGCALSALECYGQGIRSLEGIEMFPQLEQVTCSDNPLTELDLNTLPHLHRLYGINLPLKRIAIDNCHRLQHIELSHNHLETLTLKMLVTWIQLTDFHTVAIAVHPDKRLESLNGGRASESPEIPGVPDLVHRLQEFLDIGGKNPVRV